MGKQYAGEVGVYVVVEVVEELVGLFFNQMVGV